MDDGKGLHPGFRGPGTLLAVGTTTCLYFGVCGTLTFWFGPTGICLCILQVLAAVMMASEHVERVHPTAKWWMVLGAISTVAAAAVGTGSYYNFYEPYKSAQAGRVYDGLPASAKASAHSDGGIVHFNTDALLDSTRAIGFISHGHNYCVAPVLSRTAEVQRAGTPPKVQFWAVGMDCCASQADFQCDSGGDGNAHGGIVVHNDEELATGAWLLGKHSHYDEYMRAIQAAVALHELTTADMPVLVSWELNPKDALAWWLTQAFLTWFVSTLFVGIVMLVLWRPLQLWYDARVKAATVALKRTYGSAGALGLKPSYSSQAGARSDARTEDVIDPYLKRNSP